MKKIFLFVFLSVGVLGFSQSESTTTLTVTESVPFEDESNTYEVIALKTTSENQTGLVRQGKRDLAFEIFDENQKRVFSKIVDIDRKEEYIDNVFSGDEMKIFTVNETSKTERIVYCHRFNLKDKTLSKEQLFTAEIEGKFPLFAGKEKRGTSTAITPDGSLFAVATDNIKRNLNSYSIRVFNTETLKLVYEKSYQEHEERFFEPNDISIENDGTVYILGKLFKDGKAQKKGGAANYEFILNKVNKEALEEVAISLENEHIQSMTISKTENKLYLLGFYSERNVSRLKGTCNFEITKNTLQVVGKKVNPLPIEVFEDLYGQDRAERKSDKELANFYVNHVLRDDMGNTYMLAEEFYVTYTYAGYGIVITTYHYDDILIMKYDSNGDLSWGRSIFKRSTFPSYNAFLKGDTLHVLLNTGKNLTEKEDGRTKASKGWFESTALYDFEYDASGNVSYNKIQDNRGSTKYFPANGTYENNTFLMMSGGGRERQFMMLK